jgi:hypothetical protein
MFLTCRYAQNRCGTYSADPKIPTLPGVSLGRVLYRSTGATNMSSKDDKVNTTKKVAKKKATAKKVAKKAAAKTAVSKKAVTKKSVSKKAASKKVSKKVAAAASAKATISYSEYRERVAMAAYFIAEKRLFDNGLPDSDWLEGEKQVLAALAAQGIEVAVD